MHEQHRAETSRTANRRILRENRCCSIGLDEGGSNRSRILQFPGTNRPFRQSNDRFGAPSAIASIADEYFRSTWPEMSVRTTELIIADNHRPSALSRIRPALRWKARGSF